MLTTPSALRAGLSLSLLICFFRSARSSRDPTTPRVAIIGAGVGGAFSSSGLRDLLPGTTIDVFEAENNIGGRAHSFEYAAAGTEPTQTYELGASIIWERNVHLRHAAERLGLGIKWLSNASSSDEPDGFAVYDGRRFVLNRTGSYLSLASMALRYGPSPLLYGRHALKVWEDYFQRIYDMQGQEQRRVFDDPRQMLEAMGLYNLTQQTCSEHMQEYLGQYWWSWGVRPFANDIAGAINRCNYNQRNSQLNALAGLVSFLPAAGGELWAVQGGNSRLPEALLRDANASVHLQTAITRIVQDAKGEYTLYSSPASAQGQSMSGDEESHGPYDAVVIATPLETSRIAFEPQAAGGGDGVDKAGTGEAAAEDDEEASAQQNGKGGERAAGLRARACTSPEVCRWMRCVRKGAGQGRGAEAAADASLDSKGGRKGADQARAAEEAAGAGGEGGQQGGGRGLTAEAAVGAGGDSEGGLDEKDQEPTERTTESSGSKRLFQETVTTYVDGELQASYFGVRALPAQQVLVTDDSDLPFTAISPKLTAGGKLIYKVFSSALLSPGEGSELAALFGPNVKVLAQRAWNAYPAFDPPEEFAPFRLAPGLCYVNAIENAASAMEMSAIAGRNCALMTASHLHQTRRHEQPSSTRQAAAAAVLADAAAAAAAAA